MLAAIHIAIKEDENPEKGLYYIKNNIPDYWSSREMIIEILKFLYDTEGITNMPHWSDSAKMAAYLIVLVENDHI